MRLAVDKDVDGFETYMKLVALLDGAVYRIRIFIDREERKDVVMADEATGELWVFQREDNGEGIKIDPDTGRALHRSLKGFVQILVDGPRIPRGEG
jgi:hypothetical protein